MKDVYISGIGKFLPGEPVSNDQIESYLGCINGKASRLKNRILKQNGIQNRYYALDKNQRSLYSNAQMAKLACEDAIRNSPSTLEDIDFMAFATTQGDLPVPSFGSMVHGELKSKSCEMFSHQGVCASSMMALKSAFLQVCNGEKRNALVCASEFPSRLFKSSRYEAQKDILQGGALSFDTEFLRFMLSDGAGALVVSDRPHPHNISLKLNWVELTSHAGQHEACMYAGANLDVSGEEAAPTWLDYPTFEAAAYEGAINLKQDTRLLKHIVLLGVADYLKLVNEQKIHPSKIDWLLCHYSSHVFRSEIVNLLEKANVLIPEEKWFTNLYTKGNTGAASIFLMLEELMNQRDLRAGQEILCMVPESGRFITSFAHFTIVSPMVNRPEHITDVSSVTKLEVTATPALGVYAQLLQVWMQFEENLAQVPLLKKLYAGKWTVEDYKILLRNLRQQVIEGSRWIARAASQLSEEYAPYRTLFIKHAFEEHRDYEMLERDYVAIGGSLIEIQGRPKNIGSEALSAWMFHQSSQPNPFDLLGAMFIIEGLGQRMAKDWAQMIQTQLNLSEKETSFLSYHSEGDETHMEKFHTVLNSDMMTPSLEKRIVKTAKVTARLYRLQLEEVDQL